MPEFAADGGTQPPSGAQPPQDDGNGSFGNRQGQRPSNDQGHEESAGAGYGGGSSGSAALLIVQYVSIITLFGAVTVGIVKLTGKRKPPKVSKAAMNATIIDEPEAQPPQE